jgi:hypothetical protein
MAAPLTRHPAGNNPKAIYKMKRLRLAIFLVSCTLTVSTARAYRVNIDKKCLAQVLANAGAQTAVEKQHNQHLDSISARQQKIAAFTTSIRVIRELYGYSMQNIRGFGYESQFYKLIGKTAGDIVADIPVAIRWIDRKPGLNHLLCLNEMSSLVWKTEQCIADFVNIVNNGKVESPLRDSSLIPEGSGRCGTGKGDGYNYLNRSDRLQVAMSVLQDLSRIKSSLETLIYLCQASDFGSLVLEVTPELWATSMQVQWDIGGIERDWTSL